MNNLNDFKCNIKSVYLHSPKINYLNQIENQDNENYNWVTCHSINICNVENDKKIQIDLENNKLVFQKLFLTNDDLLQIEIDNTNKNMVLNINKIENIEINKDMIKFLVIENGHIQDCLMCKEFKLLNFEFTFELTQSNNKYKLTMPYILNNKVLIKIQDDQNLINLSKILYFDTLLNYVINTNTINNILTLNKLININYCHFIVELENDQDFKLYFDSCQDGTIKNYKTFKKIIIYSDIMYFEINQSTNIKFINYKNIKINNNHGYKLILKKNQDTENTLNIISQQTGKTQTFNLTESCNLFICEIDIFEIEDFNKNTFLVREGKNDFYITLYQNYIKYQVFYLFKNKNMYIVFKLDQFHSKIYFENMKLKSKTQENIYEMSNKNVNCIYQYCLINFENVEENDNYVLNFKSKHLKSKTIHIFNKQSI